MIRAVIDTDNLSFWGQAVIWGNWAGACFSLVANASAVRWAHKRGLTLLTRFYGAVTLLSAVYIGAYLILLFSHVSQPDWSRTMRFVSLVVWPLVWAGPAIIRARVRQAALDHAVARTIAKAVELRAGA